MQKSRILVTCPKGIPPFLAEELRALGFPVLELMPAAVATEGTIEDAMRLNLFVRTGHRVHYQLEEFEVRTPDELYAAVSRINWEDYIPEEERLSVDSSVFTDSITDTRFASLKCKDAIVDRIRAQRGRRPDSGPGREGAVVFLYWRAGHCGIFLDTSGESLSRRGYRKIPLKAPMQETLAAAVVSATGWDGNGAFVNPMCGSGTLAIEAALIGLGRAAGLLRGNFGFMHLLGFDAERWQALRRQARAAARKSLPAEIIATDIAPEAVEAARKNAAAAGVADLIDFDVCDFAETRVPEGSGVVVLNPEYGERMGEAGALADTYRRIGDFLKRKCTGYKGYVFTGNLELAKRVGLRPRRRIPFFNADIECRLLEYELYEGSREKPRLAP